MKVHAVFFRNYVCTDPAVPTVNNSTLSVPSAVTPPHSSLSLQSMYPFVSCCLFHDAISDLHCTVSSMIPGRPRDTIYYTRGFLSGFLSIQGFLFVKLRRLIGN